MISLPNSFFTIKPALQENYLNIIVQCFLILKLPSSHYQHAYLFTINQQGISVDFLLTYSNNCYSYTHPLQLFPQFPLETPGAHNAPKMQKFHDSFQNFCHYFQGQSYPQHSRCCSSFMDFENNFRGLQYCLNNFIITVIIIAAMMSAIINKIIPSQFNLSIATIVVTNRYSLYYYLM